MQIKEIENPIGRMHFQGLHWIEASAGTGKTFTLSSLMVRILLEKYLPRQVIATTLQNARTVARPTPSRHTHLERIQEKIGNSLEITTRG